jgi:hypothetical protein
VVIGIANTLKAPSTARCSGISSSVIIIIVLLDYVIPILWSNGLGVARFVLQAASCLNLCAAIIPTLPTEMVNGSFNLTRADCLRIGVIDLIPERKVVVPPPIVHLVVGFVNHSPHI